MMKRINTHISEDISEVIFKGFIPPEWIIRKKEKDYGIDYEMELVEKSQVSGEVIWVQLKSSKNIQIRDDKISFKCSVNFLRYCWGCEIPILLVLIDLNTKAGYWLHTQQYIFAEFIKKDIDWRSQKYITVSFLAKNSLTNQKEKNYFQFKIIASELSTKKHFHKIYPIRKELEDIWENLLRGFTSHYDYEDEDRSELYENLVLFKNKLKPLFEFEFVLSSIGYQDKDGTDHTTFFDLQLLDRLIDEFLNLLDTGSNQIFSEGIYLSTLIDKYRSAVYSGLEYIRRDIIR